LGIIALSIAGKIFNVSSNNHRFAGNPIIQWLKGYRGANATGTSGCIPGTTGEATNDPLFSVGRNNRGIVYCLFIYLFGEVNAEGPIIVVGKVVYIRPDDITCNNPVVAVSVYGKSSLYLKELEMLAGLCAWIGWTYNLTQAREDSPN